MIVDRDPAAGCCLLDVHGVGYEVFVPLRCMASLPTPPREVTLHVHTHVREEALTLFGFVDSGDRVAFRALTGVSGVGPKLAMAVLGELSPAQLGAAVHAGDKKRLGTVSGVGKKLAARLVLELKEKVSAGVLGPIEGTPAAESSGSPPGPSPANGVAGRACEALMQMGFGRADAERAVGGLDAETLHGPVEVILRRALAVLG